MSGLLAFSQASLPDIPHPGRLFFRPDENPHTLSQGSPEGVGSFEISLPGGVCQVILDIPHPGRLFFRIRENPHTLSEVLLGGSDPSKPAFQGGYIKLFLMYLSLGGFFFAPTRIHTLSHKCFWRGADP